MVIDDTAQEHCDGDANRRNCDSDETGTIEHVRQQHAEDRESGDPDDRSNEPQQDRQGDPATKPARQLPKASVKVHRRLRPKN